MAGPVLSVIVPVHGVQDYLPQCLDSVLGQAGDDVEVIAVDDASPDRCGQILDERARADPRLRVLHTCRRRGPGPARNAGLGLAAGRYAWFVDGDDLLAEGAVGAVLARLAADRPDLLLIDYEDLYPDGSAGPSPGAGLLATAPGGTFTLAEQPQLLQLTMTSWSKVFSREFLTGLGVAFGPGIHEDVPVSCAALLTAGRISALNRVCYRYRRARPGSFMATASASQLAIFDAYHQAFALAAKLQPPPGLAAELFGRAIWHYTTVLQAGGAGIGPLRRGGLVPRRDRRGFLRPHARRLRALCPARIPEPARRAGSQVRADRTRRLLDLRAARAAEPGPGGPPGGGRAPPGAAAAGQALTPGPARPRPRRAAAATRYPGARDQCTPANCSASVDPASAVVDASGLMAEVTRSK